MALIDTRSTHLFVTNATNVTTTGTSIANPADTLTAPSGDGVIPMGHGGLLTSNSLFLKPFGTSAATQTFLMSVFAWDLIENRNGNTPSWTATLLASFTCTLCTVTGLANTEVNASQFYCDTITLGAGNANVSNEAVSPTGNVTAHVVVDAKGARFVELRFARNSSAASCNCLAKRL